VKLNIGCGLNKLEGWLNLDKYEACQPDQVMDAEVFPWPFADSSVEAVTFNHSLEHMGADAGVFLALMQELYRVCQGGATVQINVPHPRHDDFINDPTHVRIVTPDMLLLFSRRQCLDWAARGGANSQLALYLNVDFELRRAQLTLDPAYQQAFDSGAITEPQLRQLERSQNNVVREMRITLEVIKS
jgi:hypothetical protein